MRHSFWCGYHAPSSVLPSLGWGRGRFGAAWRRRSLDVRPLQMHLVRCAGPKGSKLYKGDIIKAAKACASIAVFSSPFRAQPHEPRHLDCGAHALDAHRAPGNISGSRLETPSPFASDSNQPAILRMFATQSRASPHLAAIEMFNMDDVALLSLRRIAWGRTIAFFRGISFGAKGVGQFMLSSRVAASTF